jgi:hypothetical protein
MRTITLLMSIALGTSTGCGGPALGGVPHPNNAGMAGGVAAAAAALTLADPHAADRKPEQRTEEDKRPVDVKEQVPASAFDHLDSTGNGSGHELARPHAGDAASSAPGTDATSGADAGIPATPPAAKPAAKPAAPAAKAAAKTMKPTAKAPTLPSPHDAVDPDHADAR